MVNSRLDLFTATQFLGHPFFRSYGAILPSSLERVISRPLVFSTSLPVSVSGTGGQLSTHQWLFLALYFPHDLRRSLPIQLGRVNFSCVLIDAPTDQSGIVDPVSIDYAVWPRLRSRLTQSGRTWLWNP